MVFFLFPQKIKPSTHPCRYYLREVTSWLNCSSSELIFGTPNQRVTRIVSSVSSDHHPNVAIRSSLSSQGVGVHALGADILTYF